MTGESQRDDNDDFLDDDFVIEDIAPKNEDLDRLFEMPPEHAKPAHPGAADAEDVLFATPEAAAEPSATFQGGPGFSESGEQRWDGEALDLDAEAASHTTPAEAMAAAEASFTQELDSLLQGDEDFALDSERELEVIGGPTASSDVDGISEFEQSGPFVLDDGEGMWQDEAASVEPVADEEVGVPLQAAADAAEHHEPGWEPLPTAHVDDLAEVDGVARSDEDAYEGDPVYGESFEDEHAAPALVGVAAEAEGHDIYVEGEEENEVVGTAPRSGRGFRVLMSLAATVTVLAAGALVVLRPEWVGLQLQPERIEQAQVTRPTVGVDVPAPMPPVAPVAVTEPPPVTPEPSTPAPTEPPDPAVVVVEPPPVEPAPAEPTPPVELPPVEPMPPVAVEPAPPVPVPTAPDEPVNTNDPGLPVVQAPTPELPGWPTPPSGAGTEPGTNRSGQTLVRVNDELMIGEPESVAGRSGAPGGVMPGSRAFAQLQNGNFFIGNVKAADQNRITLRVDTGEVTLPIAAIARLTELGSTDYEDLQKVTSGFVRLTNNNRLVGGILSGIADDHVVLEFRKNRVMLPKSLVGQVVSGEGNEVGIRLDTTSEEDDWLRRLVERQLGTGTGAEPPPAPQGTQPPR